VLIKSLLKSALSYSATGTFR